MIRGPAACLAALLLACSPAGEPSPPTLTAQGFPISQVQTGVLGHFGDLKLRVEAPAGIEELRVSERSYDVDLAKSPEPSHFPLFGLPKRVWSSRDVTLNFRNYVDEKLDAPGRYTFEIAVTDRKGRTATATLVVDVEAAERSSATGAAEPEAALRSGDFRLERVGAGPVRGADELGISWKTIDPVFVVIRMVASGDGARGLARLQPADYDGIATRSDLARALEASAPQPTLELATANDAAAGTVFAVVHADGGYVLRTERSATSLSRLGTTVTLVGRYKR